MNRFIIFVKKIVYVVKNKLKLFLLSSNDPDFIVIGAQKCGTSSLHYYLDQHPDIKGSIPKEIHYFDRDMYFGKTKEEYRSYFKGAVKNSYFESSPSYIYSPDVAINITSSYPNIKLIVLLRDPVKRAYSAWNHYRDIFESGMYVTAIKDKPRRSGNLLYDKFYKNRLEFPGFRECINIELELIDKGISFEPAILRRGLYLEQLEIYWKYFTKDQIMIIGFKDLVINTEHTLKKVTDFIGVTGISWGDLNPKPYNARKYQGPISEEDRLFLVGFYQEANKKLFNEIGMINW